MQELVRHGVTTAAELEEAIVTEYNPSRISFTDKLKLEVRDVLNIGAARTTWGRRYGFGLLNAGPIVVLPDPLADQIGLAHSLHPLEINRGCLLTVGQVGKVGPFQIHGHEGWGER